ncbi:transglutaminase-like domain-containing protein [Anatilimnocola floriformis]|uniref:transglutaminase-like domain-containing protein n=1 Tax=Anatilimnocola floriformis TaxID=2948575 RepID=UPI0020C35C56|nr:transglutaminase-like domain-containing protein [Anatilimnocola floriformis]
MLIHRWLLATCTLLLCSSANYCCAQFAPGHFAAELKFEITGEDVELLTLDVLLPKTEARRQKVLAIEYSTEPQVVFEKDGQRYAQFRFDGVPAKLTVTFDVEIYRYDLATVRSKPQVGKESTESLAPWLLHERYLEKDAPFVQNIAKQLRGDDRVAVARACFDHVVKNMQRKPYIEKEVGGLRSLYEKKGDCTEFSDAFITLCRAKGIPARNCTGYLLGPTKDTPKHDWAEVYFEEYGWVPFDPIYAQFDTPTSFNDLRPIYLAVERQRRNAVLNLHHFWAYNTVNGDAKVKDTFTTISRGPVSKPKDEKP